MKLFNSLKPGDNVYVIYWSEVEYLEYVAQPFVYKVTDVKKDRSNVVHFKTETESFESPGDLSYYASNDSFVVYADEEEFLRELNKTVDECLQQASVLKERARTLCDFIAKCK